MAAAAACALVLMSFTAKKDNKKTVTKTFDVETFHAINVKSFFDVEFVQASGKESVEVTAPGNIMSLIDVSVKGGTLTLSCKSSKKIADSDKPKISVYVQASTLDNLKLSGSGDFTTKRLKSDKLNINISGTGDAKLGKVECTSFSAKVSGSGDVEIGGNLAVSKNADMLVSGSGDISAKNFSCRYLDIKVSGASDVDIDNIDCTNITVTVSGASKVSLKDIDCSNVSVSALGASDINLSGKAKKLHYNISGAGSVNAKKLNVSKTGGTCNGGGSVYLKQGVATDDEDEDDELDD